MSEFDLPNPLTVSATRPAPELGTGNAGAVPRGDPAELAAAALVQISGASTLTVDQFEAGVPPNLASASALVDQLSAGGGVSVAAMGSLYTLMDPGVALSLISD